MTDNRATGDADKKTVSDTTGGVAKPGADKGGKAGDQTSPATTSDASSLLLDGSDDPHYQAMILAGRKAAGTHAGAEKPGGAQDLQRQGVLTNLKVAYHEPGAGSSDQGRAAPEKVATASGAATDRAAADQATGDQAAKARLAYLQTTVQNFLPVVLAPAKGEADALLQAKISAQQAAIKAEADKGQYGPATKQAYGQYVEWLEKTALPSTRRDLEMFKLPVDEPAATHIKAPPQELKVSNDHIPNDAEMRRLDDAVRWAQAADLRVQAAQQDLLKKVDGAYKDTVSRLGLPEGWVEDIDRDHARWRHTVGPLIDNTLTARSNLEILDEVNRSGGSGNISDVLPPSASIERDKQGKLKGIHLDLPAGWDMNDPANKARADRLEQLVKETNALVRPTLPQLRNMAGHPELAVNWGDTEVHDMKGRFDANNNFLGLAGKDDKARKGEHLQDMNLIASRFDVEEKDGRVVVHQHVQAQEVPWWGYQNLIGVQNVGREIDMTRSYKPTDNVVVRTSTGYEVKQAQDLSTYKDWQMVKHYGEKSLMGALDAGILVSGAIKFGGAVKAARLAGVGLVGLDVLGRDAAKTVLTNEGVEYSQRMLAMQAGKGLMSATVGVTGILNNAGARDSGFGQAVNTARSAYFLADASLGLAKGGWNITRSVLAPTGEATAATGSLTLAGIDAASKTQRLYKYTHAAFKASEFGYIPLVADDLTRGIQKAHNDKNAHLERAAEIVAGDDAGTRHKPEQ